MLFPPHPFGASKRLSEVRSRFKPGGTMAAKRNASIGVRKNWLRFEDVVHMPSKPCSINPSRFEDRTRERTLLVMTTGASSIPVNGEPSIPEALFPP
jgi:hypothetical protein